MKLKRTWIDGLDEMLGGGLPDKSVILVEGEPGSGHDLLAQQILYKCALKEENVAYFTTQRAPEILREDFETFGWDIKSLEKTGHWKFIHNHSAKILQTLRNEITSMVNKTEWTVIDSLSYLLLTHEFKSVLEVVEFLLDETHKHGGVRFLLLTRGMHDSQTEISLQHLADGVIDISAQEAAEGVDRRIRIKKMSKVVYRQRLIPFNITERGIVIETAVRIA